MPNTHIPVRNPLETTITASIPKTLKRSIYGRAKLLDRKASPLIRYALELMESQGWEQIPNARLTPQQQKMLEQWLKTNRPIKEL